MFLKHDSPLDIKLVNKNLLLSIINIDDSLIHRQRLGLVPVCGHTVIADFLASSDGGHTGTEVF